MKMTRRQFLRGLGMTTAAVAVVAVAPVITRATPAQPWPMFDTVRGKGKTLTKAIDSFEADGFTSVLYTGNGEPGQEIKHQLHQTPRVMFIKVGPGKWEALP